NQYASGWQKHDEIIREAAVAVSDKLIELAQPQPGDSVLDVAAGTGEPGLSLAQQYPQTTVRSTDIAEEMVAIAQSKAAELGLENFEAQVADVTEMASDDGSVDAVMCRFGVMFFPDPTAAVKGMTRNLRPGRNVVLASWAQPAKNP